MIKNVLSNLKHLTIAFLFTVSSFAQNADKNVNEKIQGKNSLPNFITFKENTTYTSSNTRQIFTEQLGLKQNQSFISTKTEVDQLGYSHEKFQLFHSGIKVEYANFILHSKNGKLKSMNGDFYHMEDVKSIPAISSLTAFNKAIVHIGAAEYLWENPEEATLMNYEQPKGELVFLPSMKEQGTERTSDKVRLAYKFDIYATVPLSRGDIFIDAETGEVLYYNATIKHLGEFAHGKQDGTAIKEEPTTNSNTALIPTNVATRYSGTQTVETLFQNGTYTLFDYTRGISLETYNMNKTSNYSTATRFIDADNNWTAAEYNNANKDNAALDAHWGAEKTFDYFLTTFGRNSYNNTGGNIVSFVHYGSAYNNAYWNGAVMTYGDGSGLSGGFSPLTSLDVAAHEIGHAVCETTANLAYQKESGAMNEGFSDIWGACVEFSAAPAKSTWLIGEEIKIGGVALRSMSDPKSLNQPDTYGGTFWINPSCTPTSLNDYCGVHTNSGVLNHWFYVLAVGESGTNDIGGVYNVTGITIAKAARIAYRLESVYLTANSTYANARTFGIQSAIDLYGVGSAEVIATTNAFFAVGIGAAVPTSDITAPTPPLNLIASGTTGSTTNLTWSAATDAVGVTGYAVYNGSNLIGSAGGLSFFVTGLVAATNYTFTVKARDANGNISTASNSINITTMAAPAGLPLICSSQGTNINDERIGRVQFGTIDNITTGGYGYNDFTAFSTNVLRDANLKTITITPTWTGTVYPEGYAVFIDYNADGDFSDAGETVYTRAAATTTPAVGTFTIPADATPGPTRMRVSMRYNAIPTACQTFDYGQVEDYTIVIVPPTTEVNAKFIIQGYYNTATHAMRPVKANQGVGTSTTDVDIVTLELRDAVTFAIAATTTATLQANATVTASFSPITGSYYLVIKHRNGLQTWSAAPLTISAVTPLYDFTNLASKAFGSNMIQVEPNVWAVYSGDLNQDGNIDTIDFPVWETDNNSFLSGYYHADLNGDGNVDTIDFPLWESNSVNFVSLLRP